MSSPNLDELQVREGPHSVVRTIRGQAGAVSWLGLQVMAEGLERGHWGLVNYQEEQSVMGKPCWRLGIPTLVGTTA